jgi:hypothetical protein
MISAKRIVRLFRQTGGSGEFTKSADELADAQLSPLREDIGKEAPLIVSIRSTDEWFVLTISHLVLKNGDALCRIPLEHVEWIDTNATVDYKLRGGRLNVCLRDGSLVGIDVEAGGPYVALMNVFMYIGRVTGPPSHRALTPAWRPPKAVV